jgi:hypothetical protein
LAGNLDGLRRRLLAGNLDGLRRRLLAGNLDGLGGGFCLESCCFRRRLMAA